MTASEMSVTLAGAAVTGVTLRPASARPGSARQAATKHSSTTAHAILMARILVQSARCPLPTARIIPPMPAYWIAHAKINDPTEYKKYTDPLPDIFKKYGAKILARGARYRIMEGPEYFHRHVVIEFPSFEQDRKSTRLNSSHRCISYAV